MEHTTYNEKALPDKFLTPPIPAIHKHAEKTWARNWSVYYISQHWDGNPYGKNIALAKWVSRIDRKNPLTRQRVEAMIKLTHWVLRDYMELRFDKIDTDTSPKKSIIERLKDSI